MEKIKDELLLTFLFLSRLPIKLNNLTDWEVKVRKIPAYFPIVGYLPGIIYYTAATLSENFPRLSLLSLLVLTSLGFYFFDLFHFDGLLDMFDGFLNQSNKEKRLEIMSKGNVGPFAVFYGTLYLIIFWELFKRINPVLFVFGSVFGRYTMNVTLFFSKPAKQTGLGALLYPFERRRVITATFLTSPLVVLDLKAYFLSFIVSWSVGLIISKVSARLIDGITGDVLGGSCLIGQLFVLLLLSL